MNDYRKLADRQLIHAVKLAQRKDSLSTREDITTALFNAYDHYRWAHMYQHAAAIAEMLKSLQEVK